MIATFIALLVGGSFVLASALAVSGNALTSQRRSYAVAIAAGVLLALAYGDLFPESIELAGKTAIAGFIGAFTVLFLIETFTHAHTHHSLEEHVHTHPLTPFMIGLTLHNLTDGFAIGVSAEHASAAAGALGFGVLIHQVPVALSFVAVCTAAHASPQRTLRLAGLLGLAIPVATLLTILLPVFHGSVLGLMLSISAGILAYMATAHLLPEAQAEESRRTTGVVFAATLVLMTIGLFTVFAE